MPKFRNPGASRKPRGHDEEESKGGEEPLDLARVSPRSLFTRFAVIIS